MRRFFLTSDTIYISSFSCLFYSNFCVKKIIIIISEVNKNKCIRTKICIHHSPSDYAYFFLHPGTPLLPFLHPPPCLFQVPLLILNGLQFTHQLVLESFYFALPLFREALLQLFFTDEPLESKKSKF